MDIKRTDWSMDDFLQEVPTFEAEGTVKGNLLNYGMSNYVIPYTQVEEEHYLNYLKTLEEAGFEKYSENTVGVKDVYYSTTFEKEDIVLTVTFMKPENWKRLYVSAWLDAKRDTRTAEEIFKGVPNVDVKEATFVGDGHYMISLENQEEADYNKLLESLLDAGYAKFADNGKGFGNTVFGAIFTKENQVITVSYMSKPQKIYVEAGLDKPLSEHLQYKEEYVANRIEGAKTSLHMMELWHFGNSFVIQLKNGHFIISDGGSWFETDYLIDYLESLVPEGEKPVIEAWLVSHMHVDHCGAINTIADLKKYADRIYVEGFYFNEPNHEVHAICPGCQSNVFYMRKATENCKTTKGDSPKIYRPQTGQRYYFCDITMDIVHSQEQLPYANMNPDINDSSLCCMFNIEGQKCLIVGDAEKGTQQNMMAYYVEEYFELDFFSLPHHGFNVYREFVDYSKVKTVLATVRDKTPTMTAEKNAYLKERAEEWLMWGDGTKVFEFPYTVGNAKCLPNFEWKYHEGKKRPVQPNIG